MPNAQPNIDAMMNLETTAQEVLGSTEMLVGYALEEMASLTLDGLSNLESEEKTTSNDGSVFTFATDDTTEASVGGSEVVQGYHYHEDGMSPNLDLLLEALGDKLLQALGGKKHLETFLGSFKTLPSSDEINACRHKRDKTALITFYTRFNELVEYKRLKGHTSVPQKESLGVWVNKVRQAKKVYDEEKNGGRKGRKQPTNLLNDERVRKLNQISFDWGKQKGAENWYTRYAELVEFTRLNGHCDVKTRNDPNNRTLGRWVSAQRSHYKNLRRGKGGPMLTKEQVFLLNKINFRWTMLHPTKAKN